MSSTPNTSPWRHSSEWHTSTSPAQTFILTARTSLEGPSHLSMFSPPHHNPPSPPHTQAGRQTHSRPKVPLVLKGRRKEKRWTGISSIPICEPSPPVIHPPKGYMTPQGWSSKAGVGLEGAASRDVVVGVGQCDGWLIGSCPRGLPLSHLWRWELKGGLSLASPQLLKAARQFHRDQRGHYCCLSGEPSHSRTPQGGVVKGGLLLQACTCVLIFT